RFGERGRVGDHEGNVQQPRQGLGEERLARSGGPDQQDVGFRKLDFVVLGEVLEPLVVVVDRDREDLLRLVLADDVLVEDVADLARGRQVRLRALAALVGGGLLANDVVAQLDALVADENRGTGNQLPDFVLALAAERAVEKLLPRRRFLGHYVFSLDTRTLSTRPYFTASSAPRKKSRSVSRRMTSIDCFVCRAKISFSRSRR